MCFYEKGVRRGALGAKMFHKGGGLYVLTGFSNFDFYSTPINRGSCDRGNPFRSDVLGSHPP